MLSCRITRPQYKVSSISGGVPWASTITLLALGVTSFCQCGATTAQEAAAEKQPSWTVSASDSERLAERIDGGWFSIQPPNDFERADLGETKGYEKAGINVAVWTKESEAAIHPALTIMELPQQPSGNQDSRKFFKGILDSLKARWPDAKGTPIKHGKWNGRDAVRFQFSATAASGAPIEGFVIANVGDFPTFVVSTMQIKDTAGDDDSMSTLTNSAISCKKK